MIITLIAFEYLRYPSTAKTSYVKRVGLNDSLPFEASF